jgi:hypothetical protein
LQAPKDQAIAYAPAIDGAVIAGSVVYSGRLKPRKLVSTTADPACTAPVFTEDTVVNADGTLSNVLVYVKSGLEGQQFNPRRPLLMDS